LAARLNSVGQVVWWYVVGHFTLKFGGVDFNPAAS